MAASFFQKPKMALASCETTRTASTKHRTPESAPATGPPAEAAAPARVLAAPFLAASPAALAADADSEARAVLARSHVRRDCARRISAVPFADASASAPLPMRLVVLASVAASFVGVALSGLATDAFPRLAAPIAALDARQASPVP